MEFVSIPWGNGCDEDHENYRAWTVNLALWFTHILAGNNYRIDWGYPHLRDEKIVEPPQQPARKRKRTRNADSAASQLLDAAPRKRHKARHQASPSQEEQDVPQHSFYEEPIPQPQVSLFSRFLSHNGGC